MTLKAEPVAWYHVPYPNSGISPMVSLSQQHEPSMYGAVVPLYLVPPIMEPEIKVDKAEPVAWRYQDARGNYRYRGYVQGFDKEYSRLKPVPLYTAPPQRKPLTEEEIEKATREVWRNLPSDFEYTTSSWVEIGIRYAERAHGIGENT